MATYQVLNVSGVARTDLPANLCREIGRFIVTWAHFEQTVQGFVWAALSIDPAEGRIAVREPRITDRFDMIRDICDTKGFAIDRILLARIRKEASPLATMRHLLAHSIWGSYKDEWHIQVTRGAWEKNHEAPDYPKGIKASRPEGIHVTPALVRQWTEKTEALIVDAKTIGDRDTTIPEKQLLKPRAKASRKSQIHGRKN